ncbi:hypothetical protein CsatA_009316 [Cannabis sativa]
MGNKICNITRLLTNGPDTLVWKPIKDGSFFVKEAYRALNPNQETTHLFWDCPFARALWFGGPFPMNLANFIDSSLVDKVAAVALIIPAELLVQFFIFLGCLLESVWKSRNEAIFKGQVIKIEITRKNFLSRFEESILMSNLDEYHAPVTHSAPHGNSSACLNTSLICMVDASWKEGTAGLAVFLLDRLNDYWKWYAKSIKSASAVEAEL